MILKSYLVEKDITLLDKYFATLIYGENIGMKDDIKNEIKKNFKDYEKISLNQEEILKNYKILDEQIENTSLFSKKKIIFINEVSDKIKNILSEILENKKSDTKIFIFSQNLDKKSTIRKIFEKDNETGIIACYQDNERTLSNYVREKLRGYTGLNQQMISANVSLTNRKLIVGGGLKNNLDLEKLRTIKSKNLEGVIAGKSFYVGNIDLKEAQKVLDGNA